MLPPEEGFRAEDLDKIEDLPAHTELIDGNLVLVSPQRRFHAFTVSFLERRLLEQCPPEYTVWREMTVTLGPRQRPEPDVLVTRVEADTGDNNLATLQPEDVVLVIEVVSPDSVVRDRERKPQLYARAGVPLYWRVEEINGHPTVYTFEREQATGAYAVTGIHHDRLDIVLPLEPSFKVDLDLTSFAQR